MAKNEVCEICGSREVDWVDPETGRILNEPALTPIGIKCHGCAEITAYENAVFEGKGSPPGVRTVLVPSDSVGLDGKLKRRG